MLPRKILDLNSLMSSFLGSESFRQEIGQFHSPRMKHQIHFPDFNLESVFIKSISTWSFENRVA